VAFASSTDLYFQCSESGISNRQVFAICGGHHFVLGLD
jgi:hypothetical protein